MELLTVPSFFTDVSKLGKKDLKKLTTAFKKIESDPFRGGGKSKKILKYKYSNLYRFRIGDYRLVYCVGNKCVKMLMIGNRNNIYKRFDSEPGIDNEIPDGNFDIDPKPILTTHFDSPKIISPLPGEDIYCEKNDIEIKNEDPKNNLFKEFLIEWGLSLNEIEAIIGCSCIDEVLDLNIPDEIKDNVLRWNNPSKINELIEEPVYEIPSAEHFENTFDGTLKGFLLKIDPDQEKVARKNLKGPTLVKGGPGSGKSLVALYRIRNLMNPDSQRSLFKEKAPTVLFITYTTTLISASKQLLEPLLGDNIDNVTVNNIDKIVWKIIIDEGMEFNPANDYHRKDALRKAIGCLQNQEKKNETLNKLIKKVTLDYLISEFDWVIEGREIQCCQDYQNESRKGRGIPFDIEARKIVWDLHDIYTKKLFQNGVETWNNLRSKALKILIDDDLKSFKKYDVVIVDEAQDLSPVGLRICLNLCKNVKGFYMTADSGQSIYNRGFSWKDVDNTIDVRGRTTILKYNYRSTKQIVEASLQPLKDHGGGDPETVEMIPIVNGAKPILLPCSGFNEQINKTAEYLHSASKSLKLPVYAGAVIVRNNDTGKIFSRKLSEIGVFAEFVKGRKFDIDRKSVKVLTIHSSKGLEFPFVAVARVDSNQMPIIWNVKDNDERIEIIAEERRLLSVAMTRAMRRLALIYDRNKPSMFISEIDEKLWELTA